MTYKEKIIELIEDATKADKAYLLAKLEFYCDIKNDVLNNKLEPLRFRADQLHYKLGKLLAIAHDGISGHLEYKEQ